MKKVMPIHWNSARMPSSIQKVGWKSAARMMTTYSPGMAISTSITRWLTMSKRPAR